MKTIVVGLDGLSALDKVAKCLYIETKLTLNLSFPNPQPSIAALTAGRLKLENKIAGTLDGGKAATFAKDEAEAELDEMITQEAGHVQSIAGNNEAMIRSAGFDVRTRGGRIGPLSAPANLRADLTDQVGEIKTDWDPVHGSHEFELQRNDKDPADAAEWKVVGMTTQSKYLDKGLVSGSVHWYRVKARGTAGESPYSDPARAMAR
ncbi:MAG: fibronectin type III domain-containing protein [Flavobacteriales bacterium]